MGFKLKATLQMIPTEEVLAEAVQKIIGLKRRLATCSWDIGRELRRQPPGPWPETEKESLT